MATSLAHTQLAEQSESKKLSDLDKIIIPTDILEGERPHVVRHIIFKLAKKKSGRFYLDNCCDGVINPATKRPERIWLLNGANSIWDTDLENILKDKARYERARRGMDIKFIDGVCRVVETDVLRLEFLRKHTANMGKTRVGSGKNSFYEYDPEQEQRDRHAKQLMKIEMVIKAKDMDIKQAKKLAAFLGISFVDDLGQQKSDEAIKTELMVKADTDPSTFQKHIDSKEVEVSWLVKRAIIDNKIDLGGEGRNATWANGKGFIAKIPSVRKPYEYLTELAMTNSDEGRNFKQQLETIVT